MRNKTKIAAGQREGSWLVAVARRLRNWLDNYLSADTFPAAEGGRTHGETSVSSLISAPEQEDSATRSQLPGSSDALEHWLELVRKAAPELLVPPEEGQTQWPGAGQSPTQAGDEMEEGTLPEPESHAAPAASPSASELSSGNRQQPSTTSLQVANTPKPTSAAPPPVAETHPSRQQQRRRSHQAAAMAQAEISRRKERPGSASLQSEQTNDARLSPSAQPPDVGDALQTRFKKYDQRPVSRPAEMVPTTFQSLLNAAARARTSLKGARRDETGDKRLKASPDSALAFSTSQVVESWHSREKEHLSSGQRGVSLLGQQSSDVVSHRPIPLVSEQSAPNVPTPAQPRFTYAEPTADRWPLLTGTVRTTTETATSVTAAGRGLSKSADLWPDLPEEPPPDSMEGMQLFQGLEHVHSLDLEQQGGS